MSSCSSIEDALSMFEQGNYSAAIPVLQKLGDAGDAKAQHKLAVAYQDGEGVEKNIDVARFWYHQAAMKENIDSIFNLAEFYQHSEEAKFINIVRALYFYRKGIALGDLESQEVYDEILTTFKEQGQDALYVIDGFEFSCDDIHGAMHQIIDDLDEDNKWELLNFLQKTFFPESRVSRSRSPIEQISELTDSIGYEQGLEYLIAIQAFVFDLDL